MKNLYKAALLAALGLASVTAVQAASYSGDIIIGFTSSVSTSNDQLLDFGSVSSLYDGETFATGLSGSLSGDLWGAIATAPTAGTPKSVYATGGSIAPLLSQTAWNSYNTPAKSIYGGFAATGVAGQTASVLESTANSWYSQTVSPSIPSQWLTVAGNVSPNAVGYGVQALNVYTVNGSAPVELGTFTLNANDTVTFNVTAVPEPTTYGFLAGAGVLALSLRNQFRRKQA